MSEPNGISHESLDTKAIKQHRSTGSPIVIDLGKQKKKKVKELRAGKSGELLSQANDAIDALRAQGVIAENTQVVMVIVREKKKQTTRQLFGF